MGGSAPQFPFLTLTLEERRARFPLLRAFEVCVLGRAPVHGRLQNTCGRLGMYLQKKVTDEEPARHAACFVA